MKRESIKYLGTELHMEIRSSYDVGDEKRVGVAITYDGKVPATPEMRENLERILQRAELTLALLEDPN